MADPISVREMPMALRHVFMTVKFSPPQMRYLNHYLNDKFGKKEGFNGFKAALESLCDRLKYDFVAMVESAEDPTHAAGEPLSLEGFCYIKTWIDPTDGRMYTQECWEGPQGEEACGPVMCEAPIGSIGAPNDTYEETTPHKGNPAKLKRDDIFREGKGHKHGQQGQNPNA